MKRWTFAYFQNRSRHASNASNASNDSYGSAVSPYRDEVSIAVRVVL